MMVKSTYCLNPGDLGSILRTYLTVWCTDILTSKIYTHTSNKIRTKKKKERKGKTARICFKKKKSNSLWRAERWFSH